MGLRFVGLRIESLRIGVGMAGQVVVCKHVWWRAPVLIKLIGMLLLALCELLIVSIRFDSNILIEGQGVSRFFAERLPLVPQFVAVVLAATLVFGGKELGECLVKAGSVGRHSYSVLFLLTTHLAIFALFVSVSAYYFEVNHGASGSVFAAWSFLALSTAASWLAVLFDPLIWLEVAKELSGLILIGSCVGGLAWVVGQWALDAWGMLAFATFQLVRLFLTLCGLEVSHDSEILTIGTANFAVTVAPESSGYAGMCLADVSITTY